MNGPWAVLLAMVLAGACAAPAAAQVLQEYDYEDGHVYPVRAGLGIATQIVLDAEDPVLDFSTGFSDGWDLVRRDNVFYLRPRNIDVDTNLVVRTASRAYIFELRVVATDWRALEQARQAGVQYRIAFRYPHDAPPPPPAVPPGGPPRGPEAGRRHTDYAVAAGAAQAWLVPLSVHDDGRFTYVRMAAGPELPTGNFPAIFARETERGADAVVNSSVEGDTIVVHGTYPYLVLRHGRDVVGLRRNLPR